MAALERGRHSDHALDIPDIPVHKVPADMHFDIDASP
jgi:hypothetical protein